MTPLDMLRIATIERARWWLYVDAPLCSRVAHDKGLTAETVRQIARFYNVRRNLGPAEGLSTIASHLNDAFRNCHDDLPERAERCRRSAAMLKSQLGLHHTPYSAVTKLTWFLSPAGWTVYDSYAWKALRCGGVSSYERADNFYSVLQREKFADAAQKIDFILKKTPWSGISGARVLDAFMMLKGGFPFMLVEDALRQGSLDALPENAGEALSAAADQIATQVADDQFIKFVTQE